MSKSKIKTIYSCQECGAQRSRWEGKCSDCGAWNSFVEEVEETQPKARGWSVGKDSHQKGISKTIRLDEDIQSIEYSRTETGFNEINRVLGGGLVPGSFLLLGGAPGIGKSTLLLQMAGGLARLKKSVLYISGEESIAQTASRAQRLGIRSPLVEVACESNLNSILSLARNKKPHVLIVDSIQTVFLSDLEAAPGSVSQVRECAGHLMSLAKNENITVMLIGHITKEGNIAGPKVLEHMVDCVLSFEGDMTNQFRLLRSLKNRFGPTYELGVFQMNNLGLKEVLNPSELFLEERGDSLIGSAIFVSMEGSRPLLCEVQALTLNTPLAIPRRTSLGIDPNRLQMISAVLDRHLNLDLSHSDIFINVVGGLKLIEPSSDLAVAAAILSTESRQELESKAIFFGEVGLTGEVRGVTFPELRLKEAEKLGFIHFIIPFSNKKHLNEINLKSKKVTYIKNVRDLYQVIKK